MNEKRKASGIMLALALFFLMALCCLGGWYLGKVFADKEDEIINGNTTPSKEEVSVLPINDSVKEKITKIVIAASDYKSDALQKFSVGLSTIPEDLKFRVTMNLLEKEEKILNYGMGTSIPISMDDLDGYNKKAEDLIKAGANGTLKLSDFENMYKYIFNEDVEFKTDGEGFNYYCPAPEAYSKKNDTIYLFDVCGGTYVPWNVDIIDIASDETYYYAKTLYIRPLMEGEQYQERYILNWKFDKNVVLVGNERQEITNK